MSKNTVERIAAKIGSGDISTNQPIPDPGLYATVMDGYKKYLLSRFQNRDNTPKANARIEAFRERIFSQKNLEVQEYPEDDNGNSTKLNLAINLVKMHLNKKKLTTDWQTTFTELCGYKVAAGLTDAEWDVIKQIYNHQKLKFLVESTENVFNFPLWDEAASHLEMSYSYVKDRDRIQEKKQQEKVINSLKSSYFSLVVAQSACNEEHWENVREFIIFGRMGITDEKVEEELTLVFAWNHGATLINKQSNPHTPVSYSDIENSLVNMHILSRKPSPEDSPDQLDKLQMEYSAIREGIIRSSLNLMIETRKRVIDEAVRGDSFSLIVQRLKEENAISHKDQEKYLFELYQKTINQFTSQTS